MEQNKNVMNEEVVADYTDDQRTEIANKANDQYLKMAKEGKYKDILVKFGQNGNYSLNNLLYMLSQNPNATIAKGMGEWERAGRSIKKGAKSMEITQNAISVTHAASRSRKGSFEQAELRRYIPQTPGTLAAANAALDEASRTGKIKQIRVEFKK